MENDNQQITEGSFVPPRVPPSPPPLPPQRAAESVAESIYNLQSEPAEKQEQKVQPPPPPPIQVRSLQSDMQSLELSGGISTQPEMIKLNDLKSSEPMSPTTIDQTPVGVESSRSWRGGIKIIGIVASVLVLVLLGYYVVYPLFFDERSKILQEEENGGIVTPSPEKPIQRFVHQSLFIKLPTLQGAIQLSSLDSATIVAALQNEAVTANAPVGAIKELALQFANSAVGFNDLLSALVPGVPTSVIDEVIAPDVTAFLYFNSKGIWPGYVVRLKPTAVVADAQAALAVIEKYDLKGLYLSDPGTAQPFETGPYKGAPIRFSVFTRDGASFNYGVLGDYAVFSTSFDGFKTAIDLLGL